MEEDLPGLRGFRAAEDPDASAACDSVYPRELSELYPRATAPKWRPATMTQARCLASARIDEDVD